MIDAYEEKNRIQIEGYELVHQIYERPVLLTSPHFHSALEIIYVLEGEFVVSVGSKKYTLRPGEMVLIKAKEVHSVNILDYGMHRSFAVKFIPETICSDVQSLMEFKYVLPYFMSSSDFKIHYAKDEIDNSNIKNCMDNIMKEESEQAYAYRFATRIYISNIFLDLVRKVNIISPKNETIDDELNKRFIEIFQYISKNYADRIKVNEIAKKFGFRQSDFSADFKKITGQSFNEYLNYIRINKAKRLLISTDKSITEIAYMIGFSSTSYFINCFKLEMKITPKQFKQIYDGSSKI